MIDDRDYVGYGRNPPDPQWPSGARIAVNINLNFEGGGERSVMDGDGVSEGMLNDICGCSAGSESKSAYWPWPRRPSATPN